MFKLTEDSPEKYGIPREAVKRLEQLFDEQRIHIHGYMLLGGRSVLAEKYYEPFGRDELHRIYSITKTYVALAVGLLIKNGLVKPDDHICDYFPEKLPPQGAHPWCAEMTIKDMLQMRTCYASTTYKAYEGCDWTKSFFVAEPDHICGTVFNYDTSAAHVLGALVEKLTGMDLIDYLRKEAFDELGFSSDAYAMKDPVGVSQGGSGFMCTLRDMASVAYLVNHYGELDGKEIIPESYIRQAISNLTPTDMQPVIDEQNGYGYFIWMPRTRTGEDAWGSENGFVMYGLGGQLAVCFPKYDFCYLTIADTIGNSAGLQILYDSFYYTIYPYLRERRSDNPRAFAPEEKKLPDGIYWEGQRGEKNIIYSPSSEASTYTDGETQYIFYKNNNGWRKVSFDFKASVVNLEYTDADGTDKQLRLTYGVEAPRRCSPFSDNECRCAVQGMFKQGHLIISCYMEDEELGHVNMDFAWKDDSRLSVRMAASNEPYYKRLKGFGSAHK